MRKTLWFIPVLFTAFLALPASATNIVQNGGFTTGDFSDWTVHTWGIGTFPADPGTPPPGTTFASESACVGPTCNDPVSGAWISQNLPTVAAQTYTLSFYYDGGPSSGQTGTTELEALWNGLPVVGGTIIDAPAST
jgi:hypothetical protein